MAIGDANCVFRGILDLTSITRSIAALADSEREEMKILLSAATHSLHDFDKDLAGNAKLIAEVLNELQPISVALFP